MPDLRQSLVNALRGSDIMSPQDQLAYKQAVGAPINPAPAAPIAPRPDQGVAPVPPNVSGLAQLLVQTGRAPDIQTAMGMAQQMTAGR